MQLEGGGWPFPYFRAGPIALVFITTFAVSAYY